mmetsp:Transcript_22625/g.36971  ORF Transcript_22625/g.36971 Transcript_22625/m.36971 type:complete len:711 (+) Transcript_22625:134-2266(+)
MSSTSVSPSAENETEASPPSSTALQANKPTITSSSASSSNDTASQLKWSQRPHNYTTPTPPLWRFVNNAKSTTGYNSTAAGSYIAGLSAEELAAKYSAPSVQEDGVTKEDLDVGKLGRRGYTKSSDEKGLMEVGKLDIEEGNDTFEERMEGKVRWLSRRWDGVEEVQEDVNTTAEMSLEKNEEDIIMSEHKENEEEATPIVPIQQMEQVQEAEESVRKVATDGTEAKQEQPPKEETAPVPDEEAPLQAIETTPVEDKKQESSPLRKQRCLLLLALLMLAVVIIIGIVFGTSSGDSSPEKNDSITSFPKHLSKCPAREKCVSIRHYSQQPLPTRQIVTSTPPTNATWSLKDSCSGEVLMKCEPCLFSDTGDIAFEFVEKRNGIGDSKSDGEDIRRILNERGSSGICVPDDREYIFEVRKTDGSAEDRCCNFDATAFFVTYDSVTVVDSAHTIIDSDGGVTSTSFSDGGVSPCPTASPSAAPPEAHCVAAGEDMNLCLAIDMSGSLCNRGSGYECPGCVLEAYTASLCNRDGVEISTCCGNFHNVKEFAKRLISVFGSIPSEQSYSLVGFATNASFVSNLMPLSADALSSLDSLAYSGGRTNHAAAISSCQQTFSNPDDAVERKNMIILITDGNPTEPRDEKSATKESIAAANQVKEAGSILIPVMLTTSSIDNKTADYMTEISSDEEFLNASLYALDSVEESLLSKVFCEE